MEDMGKESFAMVVVNEEYFSEIEKEYGEFKVSA